MVSRVVSLDFKKANFKPLRESVSRVPWEPAFEGLRVHESWSLLKNHLIKTKEQAIPVHCK